MKSVAIALASLVLVASNAVAQQPRSGEAIYKEACASCHEGGAERAPALDVLRARSIEAIIASLTTGVMKPVGDQLSDADKKAVAAFIGAPTGGTTSTAKPVPPAGGGAGVMGAATAAVVDPGLGKCPSPPPQTLAQSKTPAWNGWGNDLSNGRFQPAAAAGLTAETVPKLTLKWAFAFPGATTAPTQPAVVGNRVFVGSEAGGFWSLSLATGCTYWKFETEGGVRSAPVVDRIGERYAVFFGDLRANVYAVDAETGALIWKYKTDPHTFARVTAGPAFHNGRLYVSVSSVEEAPSARPNYPCCTFRGSVVALDAASGKKVWQTYMIAEEPKEYAKNAAGTALFKPAGVAVWSTPTLDVAKNTLYVGTGNAYTEPAAPMSDSVVALDMNTGSIRWYNQATANDAFLIGCTAGNANCPKDVGPDHDFGNPPILRTVNGRRILLIGQKSGIMFGLDPDNNGKVLWQQRAGKGSALGGIEWGPAADTTNVYVANSDVLAPAGFGPSEQAGGLHAFRISDGERVWYAPPPPLTCKGGAGCTSAQSAAISVIPGVVFSGSLDGNLRAYASRDGKIIWEFNTMREFETVNGVKGAGGSIDSAGPVVVNGMVLTNSGYGRFRGKAGNVLLAFGIN